MVQVDDTYMNMDTEEHLSWGSGGRGSVTMWGGESKMVGWSVRRVWMGRRTSRTFQFARVRWTLGGWVQEHGEGDQWVKSSGDRA